MLGIFFFALYLYFETYIFISHSCYVRNSIEKQQNKHWNVLVLLKPEWLRSKSFSLGIQDVIKSEIKLVFQSYRIIYFIEWEEKTFSQKLIYILVPIWTQSLVTTKMNEILYFVIACCEFHRIFNFTLHTFITLSRHSDSYKNRYKWINYNKAYFQFNILRLFSWGIRIKFISEKLPFNNFFWRIFFSHWFVSFIKKSLSLI